MLAVAFCLILPPTSEWIELLSMLGAMMIPSSSRPSKIPANVSSILPKATSANWLPAFQPSKRTRTAKRDLPVGSNVPPKQRSFSLSKHAEKTGINPIIAGIIWFASQKRNTREGIKSKEKNDTHRSIFGNRRVCPRRALGRMEDARYL